MPQTIWFPPDYGEQPLEARAGLMFLEAHEVMFITRATTSSK